MISLIDNGIGIPAPEALAALGAAWRDEADHKENFEDLRAEKRAKHPPVLDMHFVPQMKLTDAAAAFPCLNPSYPVAWKQQVRQIRNRLTSFDEEVQQREKRGVQVVSIVSLNGRRPRKGLAANLGFALAAMESTKVLVIDAKLGCPDLDRLLGLSEARGLCDATRAEREDLPDCFRRISGTQLYLMPLGKADRYDSDAMDLRGMQRLLESLRKQFDWILLDGPGFETPADAMAVTLCADGTVYLVEQGVDRFSDLRLALQQTQGRYMIGAVMM